MKETSIGRRVITPSRRGFTLVEMMIVIMLIGILATISAPPMFRYIQSNRLQTSTDRLVADLQYARAMAIANGQIMVFTGALDGYTLRNGATGDVLRQERFDHDLALDVNQQIAFYPWGMADTQIYNISNGAGTKAVSILPTGLVEVSNP